MLGDTLLNRYRLDTQLGQGGMGAVYHSYDLLLKRTVAVKVLSKTTLGSAGRTRLLSEAQAAAKLNHPNIVTVYDAGETGDVPFIVMELVSGRTLREYTPPNLAAALEIICQVCAALEHAHLAGVIHRDLKPENVVVTPSKTVKLMDFGLARSRESPRLTEEGALMGTFMYMAPELLMGQEAGVQSDLYALGVMLYELACGQPPFIGYDPLALISQHLHATPTPPSTHNPAIPLGIETLILKLLSKQPCDRPTSAAQVQLGLETTLRAGETASTETSLDRIVRGRLVGRERELAEVGQIWGKARQGASGVLLISGEPGVGKSRLVREMIVQVQIEHGSSLVGECFVEGSAPYAPFAQMILNVPDWPDDLPQLVLADLISLAPALRVRYADMPLNPSLEPMAEQQRLYESAFTFFARLAGRTPLLLVLEDIHWADGGTLALARSLARRFRQTQTAALIVLTFREGELTEQKGLSDLLNSWYRDRMANPIKLHRLDGQGTRDMLEALFAESVTADFAAGVYRETEGNPFFIEEMCKALIEGGQVYRSNGRWQRRSTTSIEMPRSIRMAIETRLSGLPETTQEVLHLAAVLGRRFEFEVLQAAVESAAGQDEDALIAALETAEQAQLLVEVGRKGGGTFEFAHALIPTTLVEGISGVRRRRLHRRAIAALEKLHAEDYKALAHHCLEASEDQRALDFLLKAAQRARATFANAEAVANYQQAIGLLGELRREPAQEDRWQAVALQLHEDLGDALELTGQHEQAWTAFQSALALVPASERVWRSRLYRKAGKTRETLRLYDDATQAYRQAELALGDELPEATMEWRQEWIMLQLDRILLGYWVGRVQEMALLVEQVRPAVEHHGTPFQRSLFYRNLALMALRRDRFVVSDEMLSDARRAAAAARETGHDSELNLTDFLLGFLPLWRDDLVEAEKQLQITLESCERTGDVTTQARCLTYLTVAYRKRGDMDKVRSFAMRSQETAAIGQMIEYISMAQANLAWAARREGKLAEARELGVAAWEAIQTTMQGQLLNWVAVWPLIGICLAQNQIAEAVDYARKLLIPTQQPQPEVLAAPLQAAIQAWEQAQPERAYVCLTQAAALAEPMGYL